MNYYWWKNANGNVGNVYGRNVKEAKENIKTAFNTEPIKLELLKDNVFENRFTGKKFN